MHQLLVSDLQAAVLIFSGSMISEHGNGSAASMCEAA